MSHGCGGGRECCNTRILRPLLGQIGAYDRTIFSERHLDAQVPSFTKRLEASIKLSRPAHVLWFGERVFPDFDPLPNHHFGWKGV